MLLLISWAEFVTETVWLISVTIKNDQDLAELAFLAAAARSHDRCGNERGSFRNASLADLWEPRQRGGGNKSFRENT